MKIVFATGNRNKLKEIQALIGSRAELSTPADHGITEDIPEDRPTLEGNALQKARYIYEKTGLNCFADDTGLEVEALDGEPGVYSARYAPNRDFDKGMEMLLGELAATVDKARKAHFSCVLAFAFPGMETKVFEGRVDGRIATEKHGSGGFGYDPVFVPDEGDGRSFGEFGKEEKNAISHRGRAFKKFLDYLNHLNN